MSGRPNLASTRLWGALIVTIALLPLTVPLINGDSDILRLSDNLSSQAEARNIEANLSSVPGGFQWDFVDREPYSKVLIEVITDIEVPESERAELTGVMEDVLTYTCGKSPVQQCWERLDAGAAKSSYSLRELNDLAARSIAHIKHDDVCVVHVLYVGGALGYDSLISGLTLDATTMVVFRDNVYGSTLGLVAAHELGHMIGLVADLGERSPYTVPTALSHLDVSHPGHCTNVDCLMYYQMLGTANGLCDDCINDIAAEPSVPCPYLEPPMKRVDWPFLAFSLALPLMGMVAAVRLIKAGPTIGSVRMLSPGFLRALPSMGTAYLTESWGRNKRGITRFSVLSMTSALLLSVALFVFTVPVESGTILGELKKYDANVDADYISGSCVSEDGKLYLRLMTIPKDYSISDYLSYYCFDPSTDSIGKIDTGSVDFPMYSYSPLISYGGKLLFLQWVQLQNRTGTQLTIEAKLLDPRTGATEDGPTLYSLPNLQPGRMVYAGGLLYFAGGLDVAFNDDFPYYTWSESNNITVLDIYNDRAWVLTSMENVYRYEMLAGKDDLMLIRWSWDGSSMIAPLNSTLFLSKGDGSLIGRVNESCPYLATRMPLMMNDDAYFFNPVFDGHGGDNDSYQTHQILRVSPDGNWTMMDYRLPDGMNNVTGYCSGNSMILVQDEQAQVNGSMKGQISFWSLNVTKAQARQFNPLLIAADIILLASPSLVHLGRSRRRGG